MPAPVRINGIDVHEYLVKDLERAKRFYVEVMGLEPLAGSPNEFELPDGNVFGIYQPRPGDDADGTWQKGRGIFFAVDDARESVERLREHGVTVSDPIDSSVCVLAFAEDSEGNQLIIHQRKNA
jgi:predicted enzyme related to lactoylglutathione lyase